MKLRELITSAILPAFEILGAKYNTVQAVLMMLAISLQESKLQSRQQLIVVKGELVPKGPAVSFWQFEKGGGVAGVLKHPASASLAAKLCKARGVKSTPDAVWEAMKTDDVLGAGMARLLLLTDPFKLPDVGKPDEAWKLYTRVWRPGEPHPGTWQGYYDAARAELGV